MFVVADDPCGFLLCNNGGSCLNESCQCTEYCFGTGCDSCIIGTQRPVVRELQLNSVQCNVLEEEGWIVRAE